MKLGYFRTGGAENIGIFRRFGIVFCGVVEYGIVKAQNLRVVGQW